MNSDQLATAQLDPKVEMSPHAEAHGQGRWRGRTMPFRPGLGVELPARGDGGQDDVHFVPGEYLAGAFPVAGAEGDERAAQ